MLIAGLICLSIWTLAIGFTSSFIQMTVFRGPQGMGAALTIPSAVGIISSYFTGQDRTRALGLYAASGAVGFTAGLVLGGLLSSSLGWRYIFRLSVIVSALLAILGFLVLPSTSIKRDSKPEMYFLGASLSTAGLILLAFVLSGGGIYSWAKLFIIVLLILSVTLLIILVLYEKAISNPIMPLSLWKIRNFASLWVCRFGMSYLFTDLLTSAKRKASC
jgi:MFS family permease